MHLLKNPRSVLSPELLQRSPEVRVDARRVRPVTPVPQHVQRRVSEQLHVTQRAVSVLPGDPQVVPQDPQLHRCRQ